MIHFSANKYDVDYLYTMSILMFTQIHNQPIKKGDGLLLHVSLFSFLFHLTTFAKLAEQRKYKHRQNIDVLCEQTACNG